MSQSIAGKNILITGASSGIGEATAKACAKAGMHTILTARRRDKLESIQEEIGGSCKIIVGDVTETGFNEQLLRVAGPIDAVFVNAGHGLDQLTVNTAMSDVRTLFELNVFAAVELASLAARQFVDQGSGHILLCASCLSKFATAHHGSYCASKSAIEAYAKSMRLELSPSTIAVSTVHPIGTKTEFFSASATRSNKTTSDFESQSPSWLMQPPERVARAVVKCLKKPKPEVWTSVTMRLISTLFATFPRVAHCIIPRFSP